MDTCFPRHRNRVVNAVLLWTLLASLLACTTANGQATDDLRTFDLPSGMADATLKQFSAQAGIQVIYPTDQVGDIRTHAVRGRFTATQALEKMVAGTPLTVVRDSKTGALGLLRQNSKDTHGPTPEKDPPTNSEDIPRRGVIPTVAAPAKEVVELSPFTVNATLDRGFVAASALAGGRLSTDLRNTPAAYSVLTRDFIDALSLTSLTAAQQWTTGFNEIEDDGRQNQFGDGERGRRTFRGVASNQQQIEFFPAFYDYDSYNLERFDFARGPNSILFGSGSMGGTANGLYKRAQFNRQFGEVRATASSWNSQRWTIDFNQPAGDRLAFRFNGLLENNNGWRNSEYFDKKAATLTLSAKPWKGGNFRLTGEKGSYQRNASLTGLHDRFSGWDGVTTYSAPVNTPPAEDNARGISRIGPNAFSYSPGLMGDAIVDYNGWAITQGGNQSPGVPIGGQLVVGSSGNYRDQPILGGINWPSFAFDNALRGSKFYLPDWELTPAHSGPSWESHHHNVIAAFDQQIGRHLFVGVSANNSQSLIGTDFTVVRGLNNVTIDINSVLPDGSANPYFLTPFMETTRDFDTVERKSTNYRANAAIVFNETRFGSFRLNLEAGSNDSTFQRVKYRMEIMDPSVPARDWINQLVRMRYYWGGPITLPPPGLMNVKVPLSGVSRQLPVGFVIDAGRPNDTAIVSDNFKYAQAALGASFFKERLHLLGAVRRDDYESVTDQMVLRGDQPNGWNGTDIIYRPQAPEDYFSLTYIPKDAAGNPTGPRAEALARPRTNNVRQPQYANDRFRDDYSLPVLSGTVDTFSTGAVVHVLKWASVFGNYAETWSPPAGELQLDGERFVPLTSTGWDAGMRFSFLGDRIVLTTTRYESEQIGLPRGTGTNGGLANALGNLFNALANTNVLNDLSPTGMNTRGMQTVPGNYFDSANRASDGYEFELVANITPSWRVSANFAKQNAVELDAYSDTRAYVIANDALFKNILADAGVSVVNGIAVLNPGVSSLNSPDAQGSANAYNQMNEIVRNLTAAPQKVARLVESTGNLFTDYTFRNGRLKNLRLGAGVNYRGKEVIGYRGGDTIATGATTAADDPSVDATTPVYRKPYSLVTAVVGYSFKLRDKMTVRLDFRVSNLLGEDMLLYYSTVLRPPGGDITNPSRVATPSQYSFIVPRKFDLTATLSF